MQATVKGCRAVVENGGVTDLCVHDEVDAAEIGEQCVRDKFKQALEGVGTATDSVLAADTSTFLIPSMHLTGGIAS